MNTGRAADQAPQTGYRELAAALVDVSEHIRRSAHEATGYQPLPNGMLDILRVIEVNPGITVAEVAARLDRQLSNVSTQLKDLFGRGLVTRNRDSTDKRYVTLHTTAEAAHIKEVLESSWAEALETVAQRLPPAEQRELLLSEPHLARLAALINQG